MFALPIEMKTRTNFRLAAALAIIMSLFFSAKLTAQVPGCTKCNFGIDGDLIADTSYRASLGANLNSDDWFSGRGKGTGKFVIDTTGAFKLRTTWAAGTNRAAFGRKMRVPSFTVIGGKSWIQAAYLRDHVGNGADSTAFTSSNKNGDNPLVDWKPGIANVNSKNNIMDGGVFFVRDGITLNDSLYLIGMATLLGSNGSRYFDYELFKSNASYDASTKKFVNTGSEEGHTAWKFNPNGSTYSVGDLLIAVDFSGSSGVKLVDVRIWMKKSTYDSMRAFPANYPGLSLSFSGSFNGPGSGLYGYASMTLGSGIICGGDNNNYASPVPPWGSFNNSGTFVSTGNFNTEQVMEFALNLTKMGIDPVKFAYLQGDICNPAFGSVMIKSRTSTSWNSELNDFAGPVSFALPPITVTAATTNNINCANTVGRARVTNNTGNNSTLWYQWVNVTNRALVLDTGAYFNSTSAGTFRVYGMRQDGCTKVDSATVTITIDTARPNFVLNTTRRCYGFSLTGPTAPIGITYNYQWTGPAGFSATTQSISNLYAGGRYSLTVTNPANSCSRFDTATIFMDTDCDGIPDVIDIDDDNDAVTDFVENNFVALSTSDPMKDDDNDGTLNYMDSNYCTLSTNKVCVNLDKDNDGIIDEIDLDSDNDGIPDVIEQGGVDTNGDGIIDNYTDTDNDGLSQNVDANTTGSSGSGLGLDTLNFDKDGRKLANRIDLDSDNDGINDIIEIGLNDANYNGMIDGFTDSDKDGLADIVDPTNGRTGSTDPAGSGTPTFVTTSDLNNNGRPDAFPISTTVNDDGGDNVNPYDIDSDDDGITDNVEGQPTFTYIVPTIADVDLDGILDVYETGSTGTFGGRGINPTNNADTSGLPDYLDIDADDDGLNDLIEGHDLNQNGLVDDLVALTGIDSDGDGLDDRFDAVNGPVVTQSGMNTNGVFSTPAGYGAIGPVQTSGAVGTERDWRNVLGQLPVNLLNFDAFKKENGTVDVRWITTNEHECAIFEVQRSVNSIDAFATIGTVACEGNSVSINNYLFNDKVNGLSNGTLYYRLRQLDLNGTYAYSQIAAIQYNATTNVTIYPNPATTELNVQLDAETEGNVSIVVYNLMGAVVKEVNVQLIKGNGLVHVDLSGLAKGNYVVKVNTANSSNTHQVTLK